MFAHIINPVKVEKSSDLYIAQPITFETMRIARDFCRKEIEVTRMTTQYPEDREIIPGHFEITPDLDRSILEIKKFKIPRKLPLIKDILDRLYTHTTDEHCYLIYTNPDIALMPYFYQAVYKFIRQGYDAFVIDRRTISDRYSSVEEIPLMYAEIGDSHPGYDCFVFKRDVYPHYKLGNICIGTAGVGRALLANMVAYSADFRELRDKHLTFHIGDAQTWRNEEYSDDFKENRHEYLKIFPQLEAEHGMFDPVWRSYLLDSGEARKIPDFA